MLNSMFGDCGQCRLTQKVIMIKFKTRDLLGLTATNKRPKSHTIKLN